MAAAVVMVEGVQRLGRPVEVVSNPVAWAAFAGIVVNLLSAHLFGHDNGHDLNRRAPVVHRLSDPAVSAAVLGSALLIRITGLEWLDSLMAIGVGLAVARSGWSLRRSDPGIPQRGGDVGSHHPRRTVWLLSRLPSSIASVATTSRGTSSGA
jgi:cobalt-zinc-cadmium efflux system protein